MKKSLLFILITFSLVIVAPAQRQKTRLASPLVDNGKPAVYISYLRSADLEPLHTGYGRNHLLFRITNNTRWPIWLEMSGVLSEKYGDATLYYRIEAEDDGRVRLNYRCHVCSVNPLSSGRSIRFSIPLDEASRDALLRLTYSFQWERDKETDGGSNSTHSVVFHFIYLPKSVLLSDGLSNNSFNRTHS